MVKEKTEKNMKLEPLKNAESVCGTITSIKPELGGRVRVTIKGTRKFREVLFDPQSDESFMIVWLSKDRKTKKERSQDEAAASIPVSNITKIADIRFKCAECGIEEDAQPVDESTQRLCGTCFGHMQELK